MSEQCQDSLRLNLDSGREPPRPPLMPVDRIEPDEHADLIARVEAHLERRAETELLARTEREHIAAFRTAIRQQLTLARTALGMGGAEAAAVLEALEADAAALVGELDRIESQYRSLERRSQSKTIWACAVGAPGMGKSAFINSAAGVPGLFPSRRVKSVTGTAVRAADDPHALERYGTIWTRDGMIHPVRGDEIDDWVSLRDRLGEPLYRYRTVVDAEVRAAFGSSLGRLFTWVDTPGVTEAETDDERMVQHAKRHWADALFLIDRPDPLRDALTPLHRLTYSFTADIESFFVLNFMPGNDEIPSNEATCASRRDELIALGVSPARVFIANCTSPAEVNRVLVACLEAILDAEEHRHVA